MKHTWKVVALAGGIALFGFGASVGAAAVSGGQSNATINFSVPSDPPDVLDPTDLTPPYESGPGDPVDKPTENTGSLTLDYVSSLNFGEQVISTQEEVYESTILRPFIQVSDRRGLGIGWHVTAQLGEFKDENSNTSLEGAFITLANGELKTPGATSAPLSEKTIEIISDGDAMTVINAAVGTGQGTWINRWFPSVAEKTLNDNVTLTVPGGTASAGTQTAVITWTLMDAPQ